MDTETAQARAREKAGVMLPDVDPMVGEIVLSAFFANEQAKVGEILAALIKQAPEDMAAEIAAACFELLLCREKGSLRWLDVKAHDILVGIRPLPGTQLLAFGPEAKWPMTALLAGPPKSAVIRLTNRAERVWLACDGLEGAVVRQTEAVALGNVMVEAFGGRIIEDRLGGEAMQHSFMEGNMTARAKRRAVALDAAERMTVERKAKGVKQGHIRLAMAEAAPGACEPGLKLAPEGKAGPVYEVERRVNESWVIITAVDPGQAGSIAEPADWVALDGAAGPFGDQGPAHWGFTEQGGSIDDGQAVQDAAPSEE